MKRWIHILLVLGMLCIGLCHREARAQTFGIEAHNTLMPASGAMGGASLAMPQDVPSAINGNPATLTQFHGTQFCFSGAWAEPTFNLTQTEQIPIIGAPIVAPFSAKSQAPGLMNGNIGVTQDFSALGRAATLGIGFVSTDGGFIDFRQVPESNGTNTDLVVFAIPIGVGIDLTDRLSVGASMAMGIGFFDGPFVDVEGMSIDYSLRGALGADYKLNDCTSLGLYYQTAEKFRFKDAVTFTFGQFDSPFDVNMELPQNIGLGFANHSLMDGKLLVAVDVLYKLWEDTDLYGALYDNQWVVQVGTQYSMGRYRLRAGYVWAEDPLTANPGANLGGVIQPGGTRAAFYSQALMAVTSQHRLSGGIGVVDILPGVDLDLMAGGMFRDHATEGDATQTSIASYWLGFGLTWRFNRGACPCASHAPDQWGCACNNGCDGNSCGCGSGCGGSCSVGN